MSRSKPSRASAADGPDVAEDLPFEQALEELESLVSNLEGGGQSLEQSLETFERGIRLVRQCGERLQSAELRLKQLEQTPDGPVERDFEEGE